MGRRSIWAIGFNAALLAGLGWLAVLLELAPLRNFHGGWPAPDLLFCVAAFFALRRPGLTPAALILLLGLARDLVTGAPVGLGALTLLAAAEALRALSPRLRRRTVFHEIFSVWLAAAAMIAAHAAVLLVTLAPVPALDQLLFRLAGTGAAYVLLHVILGWALGLSAEPTRAQQSLRRAE